MSGKTRNVISIQTKREIIRRAECGAKQRDLVKEFGLSKGTICTIIGMKDAIKSAVVAKGVSKLFHEKHRSSINEEMERLLTVWLKDRQTKSIITNQDICRKAKDIFNDLRKNMPATSEESDFKASRGWLFRFKKRCGIPNASMLKDDDIAVKKAADAFFACFQNYLTDEGYYPQQVFNIYEGNLFWKRLPNRILITKLLGHRHVNDMITFVFSSNVKGNPKIAPLLIHSENSGDMLKQWLVQAFAPTVKKYLQEKQLPLKALLILGLASSYPPDLQQILEDSYAFIKIQYLPPDTITVLQPTYQQVIVNFKKMYLKALFNEMLQERKNMTVQTFWQEKFDRFKAIELMQKAWKDVPEKNINLAWQKLTPFWTQEKTPNDSSTIKEINILAGKMNLEVDNENIEYIIGEYEEEPTTEELQELLEHEYGEVLSDNENISIEDVLIKCEEQDFSDNPVNN